jgi:Tol biopolymer transport system component
VRRLALTPGHHRKERGLAAGGGNTRETPTSLERPNSGIYRTRADGSGEPQRLTQQPVDGVNAGWPSSFSPDGKLLAVSSIARGFAADIWTASIEEDSDHPRLGKPEPFLHTPGFATEPAFAQPAFSPDGRWLAFALGETGRSEVYVKPFPGPGGRWRISAGGGQFPIWSPNGRELFFLGSDQRV